MDLTDRLVEHDAWLTERLLARAAGLPDEALDRPLRPGLVVVSFEGVEPDLRTMLERLIYAKEVWVAAIAGREVPGPGPRAIEALRARQAAVQPAFTALVHAIRERGAWDEVFVDAQCTPPATFTLGGVIASILSYAIIRRQHAIDLLHELGVAEVESSEPIDWERAHGVTGAPPRA